MNRRVLIGLILFFIASLGIYTFASTRDDDNQNNQTNNESNEIEQDTTAPIITLNGDPTMYVTVGGLFVDPGATANDNVDGDITDKISVGGTVDTNTVGSYQLTYDVTDEAGNKADTVTRAVIVSDPEAPVIRLIGDREVTIEVGSTYTEQGATVTDNYDENLTVTITGTVDTNVVGTYTVYYNATDSNGNSAVEITRLVHVVDTTEPVINLTNTDLDIEIEVDNTNPNQYTEEYGTITDNYDATRNITDADIKYEKEGLFGIYTEITTIDTSVVANYRVRYNATDANGNKADEIIRMVKVIDTKEPIVSFSVNGNSIYAKRHSTVVTVSDNGELKTLKYLWLESSKPNPQEEDFTNNFDNGTQIRTPSGYNGSYVLWILAIDKSNNQTIQNSNIFNLDNAVPTVIFAPNGNTKYEKNHSTVVNVSDINGLDANRVRYVWTTGARPDWNEWFSIGQKFNDGDTISSPSGLNGVYYLWVMAEDSLENRDYFKSNAFYFDNEEPGAPTVSLKVRDDDKWINYNQTWTNQSVKVILSINDNIGSGFDYFEYSTDEINWTQTTNEITYNKDTNIQLWFRAVDKAGNLGVVAGPYSIKIDKSAPTVTFAPNGNTKYEKNHSTVVNVSDINGLDANRVRYVWTTGARPDWNEWFSIGQKFNDGDTISSPSGLNGVYYLWVMAEDSLGNRDYFKSNAFYFDNTPPTITYNGKAQKQMWENEIEADKNITYIDVNPFVVTDNFTPGELTPYNTTIRYQKSWERTNGTYNHSIYTNKVDLGIPGIYRIDYHYKDTAGNNIYATKYIPVKDTTNPTVTENSNFQKVYNMGSAEPNWEDAININENSSLPTNVIVTKPSNFDMNIPGEYTIKIKVIETNTTNIYEVWDTNTRIPLESNEIEVTIKVIDHIPPEITYNGFPSNLDDFIKWLQGKYKIVTATDNYDTDVDINYELIYDTIRSYHIPFLGDWKTIRIYGIKIIATDDYGNKDEYDKTFNPFNLDLPISWWEWLEENY